MRHSAECTWQLTVLIKEARKPLYRSFHNEKKGHQEKKNDVIMKMVETRGLGRLKSKTTSA